MEHILDIETEIFEKIKSHEIDTLFVPGQMNGQEVKLHDTLKLYHPGEDPEALRLEIVEIFDVAERERQSSHCDKIVEEPVRAGFANQKNGEESLAGIRFELLEWMIQIETELDDLLREERKWLEEL